MSLAIVTCILICIVNAPLGAQELPMHGRRFEVAAVHEAADSRPPEGSLVGLDAMSPVLAWLAKLPRAFEQFVGSEQRQQIIRRLRNVSKAFASVNVDCITLAALVERPGFSPANVQGDFDALLASITQLRSAVLELAGDLGGEWLQEGSELASELSDVTKRRGVMTSEARRELLGGDPKAAAKKLHAAADLAENGQKMVIRFLQTIAEK
jgi:hypothetical protein